MVYMLTWLGYIDGQCYHIWHTWILWVLKPASVYDLWTENARDATSGWLSTHGIGDFPEGTVALHSATQRSNELLWKMTHSSSSNTTHAKQKYQENAQMLLWHIVTYCDCTPHNKEPDLVNPLNKLKTVHDEFFSFTDHYWYIKLGRCFSPYLVVGPQIFRHPKVHIWIIWTFSSFDSDSCEKKQQDFKGPLNSPNTPKIIFNIPRGKSRNKMRQEIQGPHFCSAPLQTKL